VDVTLAYIENGPMPFGLDTEDIIYLNDLGISADVVTAMLRRDAALREQGAAAGTATTNRPATDRNLPVPDTNAPPAAPPVYVTNAPPPAC